MPSRRDFLLAGCGLLLGRPLWAGTAANTGIGWQAFLADMQALAAAGLPADQAGQRGAALMRELDVADPAFLRAVEDSWESGNAFWLWQRLTKQAGLNGGILTIERGHDVPLHDHPGATGMVRILSGEAEVWQFDAYPGDDPRKALLRLTGRRLLRPGDSAVLTPRRGNIHALRARSAECRMLDYFIPPYRRAERHWYRPLVRDWRQADEVGCARVAEHDFSFT